MNLAGPSWHLFAFAKRVDFVMAWKAISIVFTGAFGILGLATDFKNKHTHKITKWGRVSLIGIIVSTILGVAAQLKESSDDAAKALALAQKSDDTLQQVHRLVSPINDTAFFISLSFDCKKPVPEYATFCAVLKNGGYRVPQSSDYKWPSILADLRITFTLFFFVRPSDADDYLAGTDKGGPSDLNYIVDARPFDNSRRDLAGFEFGQEGVEGRGTLILRYYTQELIGTGNIISTEDLWDSTLLIVNETADGKAQMKMFRPTFINMVVKNHFPIGIGQFREVQKVNPAYRYDFPKSSHASIQ
jgi:hypothetical protein